MFRLFCFCFKGVLFLSPSLSFLLSQMLQVEKAQNSIALNEFEVEVELLCRLNHDSVIRILGAGTKPRPYIILERLRDLNVLLGLNNSDGGTFMKSRHFSFPEVLRIAKDLADALDYCHTKVHGNAMIIHRDLKPENLGLTAEGRLKLFDFGLCRCVQKREKDNDAYEMTGNSGESESNKYPTTIQRQSNTHTVVSHRGQ